MKSLNPSFYAVFEKSDISNQKLIALIAVMQSDSLFFDFVHEVYYEKLLLGMDELADSNFGIFFKDKQRQSERVAKWTDATLKNLQKAYKGILVEAGLIERGTGKRKISRPIMDKSLEECLKANDMEITLRALTGVR